MIAICKKVSEFYTTYTKGSVYKVAQGAEHLGPDYFAIFNDRYNLAVCPICDFEIIYGTEEVARVLFE